MLFFFVFSVLGTAAVLAAIAPEILRDLAIWAAITTLAAVIGLAWVGGA